jgi:ribosome-binding factor A
MTVNIDTADLASYTDPTRPEQRSPDLLRLRPGTPVRILTARQVQDPSVDGTVVNGLSELMDRRSNPAFLRHAILDGPNGPALVASEGRQKLEAALSQIEQSLQSGRLTDWFYTRTVELRFSKDDGFNASIELANYVEARNDPRKLSPDDKAANDATKASLPDASSTAAEDARADAITSNIEDEINKNQGGL